MHRLRKGVAYLVCLGKTNVEILDLDLAPPAIAFVPTGNDTDSANLAAKCDSALVELATLAGCMNAPTTIWNANNFKNVRNSANVNTLATQLAGRQAHCLTVWARQDTTLYYQVEEFKTVRNVYFLKQKDAAVGYKSYTKGLSKAIIVVLRVRRALIVGLVDDFSDHMAERTPITVLPNVIEIFVALNPDWFCNPHYRDNNANWINIRDWGV